jgi:hypothetical protein
MRSFGLVPAVLISIGVSISAQAAPVYLQCSLGSLAHGVDYEVTLDEDAGTAGYVVTRTGASEQRLTATFSPTRVVFHDRDPDAMLFTIDRRTLEFTEQLTLGGRPAGSSDVGACQIAPRVKRAF